MHPISGTNRQGKAHQMPQPTVKFDSCSNSGKLISSSQVSSANQSVLAAYGGFIRTNERNSPVLNKQKSLPKNPKALELKDIDTLTPMCMYNSKPRAITTKNTNSKEQVREKNAFECMQTVDEHELITNLRNVPSGPKIAINIPDMAEESTSEHQGIPL